MFVNAYNVHQSYGGPEEGGWWRDVFEPLESVKVDSDAERDATLARLRKRYDLDEDGNYLHANDHEHPDFDRQRSRGRTSCAGGYDVAVYCEDSFAQLTQSPDGDYE